MNKVKISMVCFLFLGTLSVLATSSNAQPPIKGECVLKEGYPMAEKEILLDWAICIALDGDREAFGRLIRLGLVTLSKPGVRVYIIDSSPPDKILIRVKGRILPIWTLKQAVECPSS